MNSHRPTLRRRLGLLYVSLLAVSAPAAENIVWKPVANALLRIDDRPAKLWNVYRAEKKDHLLLVELGRRFLMLDLRDREIYELDPARLERKDKLLLWNGADKPGKPLPTADWLVRDAGRARRIRAKLSSEGRVLEVQLPRLPDLRSLY